MNTQQKINEDANMAAKELRDLGYNLSILSHTVMEDVVDWTKLCAFKKVRTV